MSLLKMISSPYSVLHNLRVHKVSGSVIKFITFEIRWAVMSFSVNVEGLLLVFIQKRYLGSITKGKVGLSLNFYFGDQTFLRVSS